MNRSGSRILRSVAIVLLALILGAVASVWVTLSKSVPPTDGSITVTGLDDSIEITVDSMGIAQVWAQTEHDALYGLGWLHAADRGFQMDLLRRISQGRLSEMLGDVTLDYDRSQRLIGHDHIADSALERLSFENRSRLEAYRRGINGFRAYGGTVPIEFRLLPVDFEPWRVYDCLTLLSFETWFSDALQNNDEFFAELDRRGKLEQFEELLPLYPDWAPATVKTESVRSGSLWWDPVGRLRDHMARAVTEAGYVSFGAACGSNAWVTAPHRNRSGRAMLASDPHLEITRLPQFWYYVGLHIAETDLHAAGISIPGLPFIVMGHNRKTSWAFTAAGVDVTDYYREKLHPDDSNRYRVPDFAEHSDAASGPWTEMVLLQDTIAIAGRDSVVVVPNRYTRHGPVLPELGNDSEVVAVRWAGRETDLDAAVEAGFELMKVTSPGAFRSTVRRMGALDVNWMYADSMGNIAYQLGTPIPDRRGASPRGLLKGWNPADNWKGFCPGEESPYAVNPATGWLANCNNAPSASHQIPGNYASGRIQRLTHLLTSQDQFSPADFTRMQLDRVDSSLLRWRDIILSVRDSVTDTAGVVDIMAAWDGSTDTASPAPGLILTFVDALTERVFHDELGHYHSGVKTSTLERIYRKAGSRWIDDVSTPDRVETRRELAARALRQALAVTAGRSWGTLQTLEMNHPMAGVPIVSSILGLGHGPWPWGGTAGTLNASYNRRIDSASYRSIVGPSWRFVIDFAQVDSAGIVLPAGNSGNPMSDHFFDFFELWREGRTWTVPTSREAVYDRAAGILSLIPENTSRPN